MICNFSFLLLIYFQRIIAKHLKLKETIDNCFYNMMTF